MDKLKTSVESYYYRVIIILILMVIVNAYSCNNASGPGNSKANKIVNSNEVHKKPLSSYQDTFFIDSPSAVFYQPDSIQLQNIKKVTETRIYESSMHEYFYQVRNAHLVLKKNWPQLKILDSKNVRYLEFIKADKTRQIIDLNDYGDAYGMFLFDTKQSAVPVDMSNLDEAFIYFSK